MLLGFTHAQTASAINSPFPSRYRYSSAVTTSGPARLVGYIGLHLTVTRLALGINHNLEMHDDQGLPSIGSMKFL